MKIAYLFPGQGAQYVGMGREFFEKYERARNVFKKAHEILGFDIAKLCFEGPQEELTSTSICQSAIFTMSLACLEVLRSECPNLIPQAVAGLSLGEFTALTVAEGLSFEEGLRVVRARGQFMQDACSLKAGTMASILGMDSLKVKEICQEVNHKSLVSVANVNSPGQIAISGELEGVRKAVEMAKAAGAKRAIELQVSGAFHSLLMKPAQMKLKEFLSKIEIKKPKVVFISNVLGKCVENPVEIHKLLIAQVTNSVLWDQGIRELVQKGFDTFIEVGCGRVLSGLQRKIAPETTIFNIEDVKSLEELKGGIHVARG